MPPLRRQRGFAMVTALLFVAVLSILTGMVALFAVNNARHTKSNVLISRTLAVAQGARNLGAALLSQTISAQLGNEIDTEAQSGTLGGNGTWVFDPTNTHQNAATPDPNAVIGNLQTLATNLQQSLSDGGCYGPYALSSGEQILVRVTFTGALPKCDGSGTSTTVKIGYGRFLSGSRSSTQSYTLPYVMVVSGVEGSAKRTLTLTGQYNFDVGNGSFSRYALFTDSEQVASGSYNYLTGAYLFDGPVHTNGNFAFYGNQYDKHTPGTGQPYFFGKVGSAGVTDRGRPGAYFMPSNGGYERFRNPSQLATPSYRGTTPSFQKGVDWQAPNIPLPTNDTDQAAGAKSNGLYINGGVASIQLFAGDDAGNTLVQDPQTKAWQPAAGATATVYQYIKVCATANKCSLYRSYVDPATNNKVLALQQSDGTWLDQVSPFNGVIYAKGNVSSFSGPARPVGANDASTTPPAVAAFSQLDLVSSLDVRVTGDLKYQDPVCDGTLHRDPATGTPIRPTCQNDPAAVQNVLGIYASGTGGGQATCSFPQGTGSNGKGNVCFGYSFSDPSLSAPSNLEVDASIMAANKVDMEHYATAPVRGTLSILGGVITKYDGVFGVFNPYNGAQLNGVLPRFTYDPRFDNGLAPPLFPQAGQPKLTGTVAPIIYSQTEQVAN